MDLRRLHTVTLDEPTGPPLDGGNLIAKLLASGGLWGEVGSRVGFCQKPVDDQRLSPPNGINGNL